MATTILLSVPENLLTEVKETAKLTHLSIHEVFLRSVKIAKPALRQSARVVQPKRLSLWDALASGDGLQLRITPIEGDVKKVDTISRRYSGSAKTVAEKKTRRRDADECDRDGRAPQHRKCVAMTFLEPL